MTRRAPYFYVCILLAGLFAVSASADIAVKPANVTVNLDKGRPSGLFVVSNTGSTEERYRVRAAHFGYTLAGGLQLLPPDEDSLAPWVKFNPKEFTLPPGTKRAVRFVVLTRGALPDGEYWGAMELESLNTDNVRSEDKEGRKVNIKIVPSVIVPIFGRAGNVYHQGVLDDLTFERGAGGAALAVTVVNTGLGRMFVRGRFSVIDEANREVFSGDMPRGLVLPGKSRRFESLIESPLDSGRYTVRVEYGANPLGERILANEATYWLH